jgi:hypothetical protein
MLPWSARSHWAHLDAVIVSQVQDRHHRRDDQVCPRHPERRGQHMDLNGCLERHARVALPCALHMVSGAEQEAGVVS